MKISGSYTMRTGRTAVWEKLVDPAAIAHCLPGVEKLDKVGEDEYSMAMTVGIGPVRGTYTGTVRLVNLKPPSEYQLQVQGQGGAGIIRGSGSVRLSDTNDGGTTIQYDGNVEAGGSIGSVAQRMLGGVAKRMIDQFFECIEGQTQQL